MPGGQRRPSRDHRREEEEEAQARWRWEQFIAEAPPGHTVWTYCSSLAGEPGSHGLALVRNSIPMDIDVRGHVNCAGE